MEHWFCDNCNEMWTIKRGSDGWKGECPSCEGRMDRITEEQAKSYALDAALGDVEDSPVFG